MIHKILRLFVNTLTVDDKHYLLKRDNLKQLIQTQLSQKRKTFTEFFFAFLKSIFNSKHLPKKMTLIGDVFQETPVKVVALEKLSFSNRQNHQTVC